VYVLSSYPPHIGRCVRKVRHEGAWTAQTFKRPTTVQDYNSAMGGTDLHDMRIAFLRTTVKSRRWQVRVLTDMFSSMLMNAYVLRKLKLNLPNSYSSFDFITEFISVACPDDESVEQPRQMQEQHPATKNGKVPAVERPFWSSPAGRAWRMDGVDHWLEDAKRVYYKVSNWQNDKGELIRSELRRLCRWCGDKTIYFCTKCQAPLCISPCFRNFHTIKCIPQK
jgi:hypothetical protein